MRGSSKPRVGADKPLRAIMPRTMHDAPSPSPFPRSQALAHCGSTAEQVDAYRRLFPAERERLEPLLQALACGERIHSRSRLQGHVTASGIAVRDGRLLTVLHPRLHRWIQPGGHLEPDERPEQAALRETEEETAVRVHLHPWHIAHRCPLDIDVHEIPANPSRGEPARQAELRTRWSAPEELREPGLRKVLDKLAGGLAGLGSDAGT